MYVFKVFDMTDGAQKEFEDVEANRAGICLVLGYLVTGTLAMGRL
jgi:hypothetical protein